MRDKGDFAPPEQRASTGLPLSVMLLSTLTIVDYLIVGGVFLDNESGVVAVCGPQQINARHP
ncbi:hypothetical protein [Sinorhizobium meliloti]|uniref:hypothetical protein n=1 Tax=Rhizobium meliloti TaxID=382 RepID=UPI000429FA35|nr:hypothetical protein [Sinorhizobium meliloti]